MSREPSTPETEQPEQSQKRQQPQRLQRPEQAPPRDADDDSAADSVWITRWKNEGGAYLPTD